MSQKGRGALGVPKVEQSTRSQLYLDTRCLSDGKLLLKSCTTPDAVNKVYEPLIVGRGLGLDVDDEGNLSLTGIGFTNADGTLILDDGANWRVTLVFRDGVLFSVTIGASVAALASWTPA